MSDSRQQILAALRKNLPQASDLPGLEENWQTFPDPVARFAEVLHSVGGSFVSAASVEQGQAEISRLIEELQARKIASLVPELSASTFDLSAVTDPHALEDVDLAILPGRFGVAENGAIWVEGEDLGHRAVLFIAQHVVLVLEAGQIVQNMHEAYARLTDPFARFGLFVSGPSKTADIEQSLVIGAHGARSLTVLLLDAN